MSQIQNPFFNLNEVFKPQTPFRLPPSFITDETVKQEEEAYKNWLELQQLPYLPDSVFSNEKESREAQEKDAETRLEFTRRSGQYKPGRVDKAVSDLLYDTNTEGLVSVGITGDTFQYINARDFIQNSDNIDEVTFRAAGVFGFGLSPEAQAPMFLELASQSSQATKFAALRMRGGLQGELWKETIEKSEYLKRMFTESPETKDYIDKWGNVDPYFFSTTGATSLPFTRVTPLDVLNSAKAPEGWDAKQAVEEFKQSDPVLSRYVFETVGLDENRLVELAKNPESFKFFVADSIDAYAMGRIISSYEETHDQAYISTYVWPLFRDSFNSNDVYGEALLVGGGYLLSATGIGAAVGIPAIAAGVTKFAARTAQIATRAKRVEQSFELMYKLAKATKQSNRVVKAFGKFNKAYQTGLKFLPTQIGDTVGTMIGKRLAKDSWLAKALTPVVLEEGAKLSAGTIWKARGRNTLKFAVKSFIGEAFQGAIEDTVRQVDSMDNGFQQGFDGYALGRNMVEEGLGGIFLGGTIKLASTGVGALTKVGDGFVIKKLEKGLNNLIPEQHRATLRKYSKFIKGFDAEDKLTVDQYIDMAELEWEIYSKAFQINQNSPLGNLLDPANTSEALKPILTAMSLGNPERETAARLDLLGKLSAALEKSKNSDGTFRLTSEDLVILAYSIARADAITADSNNNTRNKGHSSKLLEGMFNQWSKEQTKEGETPLTVETATEKELNDFAASLKEKEVETFGKLDIQDINELQETWTLKEEDKKVIQSVIDEETDLEAQMEKEKADADEREKQQENKVDTSKTIESEETDSESLLLASDEEIDKEIKIDEEIEIDEDEKYNQEVKEYRQKLKDTVRSLKTGDVIKISGRVSFGNSLEEPTTIKNAPIVIFSMPKDSNDGDYFTGLLENQEYVFIQYDEVDAYRVVKKVSDEEIDAIIAKRLEENAAVEPIKAPDALVSPGVASETPAAPEVAPAAPEVAPVASVTPEVAPVAPEVAPVTPEIAPKIEVVEGTADARATKKAETITSIAATLTSDEEATKKAESIAILLATLLENDDLDQIKNKPVSDDDLKCDI